MRHSMWRRHPTSLYKVAKAGLRRRAGNLAILSIIDRMVPMSRMTAFGQAGTDKIHPPGSEASSRLQSVRPPSGLPDAAAGITRHALEIPAANRHRRRRCTPVVHELLLITPRAGPLVLLPSTYCLFRVFKGHTSLPAPRPGDCSRRPAP
jgi:hypothetical protein